METKLRLNNPPKFVWGGMYDQGMPIGNGRLGAMVPGQVGLDNIVVNQDSLWTTPFIDRSNPDAKKNLEKIRQLLREGKAEEADMLCYRAMTSVPKYMGAYVPMCNIWTQYRHNGTISGYKRVLDIENGMAYLDYMVDDVKVHREYFVSYEKQAFVMRITADKPIIDVQANLMRRPYEAQGVETIDKSILHIKGRAGEKGVKFDCLLSAKTDGQMEIVGDYIHLFDASEATFYLTADTDFYTKKPFKSALKDLKAVMADDYEDIKAKHIDDFSGLYNRTSFSLCSENNEALDVRLEKIKNGEKEKGIFELFFNYAKYLTISASRPGSQAMNLQGIWCEKHEPEWDCNYTININTEMNYWIAELAQLSDCHEPLFDFLERMVPKGEKVAKDVYGCDGFVAHHASNLWGDCAINGNSFPSSIWPVGGAWLIKHMWEHYLHTGDKQFLKKRAFPIMKKAALFFTQYMTEAEDGYFETGPSLSPENPYIAPNGRKGMHCMAPEMDNQIVRSLFRSVVKTYEILDCCDKDYEKYKAFMGKIRPTRINKNGGIMEWDKDYTELDPGHRHISPIFALHPDYEITPEKTPELAKACEATFNRRLAGSEIEFMPGFAGWNGAWLSCCYAKLKQGEKAIGTLYNMFKQETVTHMDVISQGLLVRAPVFQIESSFGIALAVMEMILYSDEDCIQLLPALPEEFKEKGSIRGMATRGAFTVDMDWADGKVIKASITSRVGNECRIKAEGLCGVDTEFTVDGDYLVFKTEPGTKYELSFN